MALVDQKPADSGRTGWNAILTTREPYATLSDDIEVDFLVVGAGFAGLSAARRIRQLNAGASIAIVDAVEIGDGPAGRSSGFMIDLPHAVSKSGYAGDVEQDRRDIRNNRAAIAFARQVSNDWGFEHEAFDPCGKINAAASAIGVKHNQTYATHLSRLGEECELLDADAMQATCGSDYYLGGLRTPGTVMIQPALYLRRFASALVERENCQLFECSPIVELGEQQDRWKAETAKGSILASRVILAVNGLIETFGFYQKRLMHINLYASMTRVLNTDEMARLGGESSWGFTPSDALGSTVRRINTSAGDRLLIRNGCTYDPSLQLPSDRLEAVSKAHRRTFDARFPMLESVALEYCWSGRLCLSRNHAPAIAELKPGLFSACCQNGLGLTRGTIGGVIAAEMASDYKGDSLLPDYDFKTMPNRLIAEPFMSAGARAVLRLKEWRAGREK
ncbi:MAG: glycine/D-amino acid oxidase-like deaminating enzyme [Planctomycetota bacterium]|jgi:glycine/D-amino acid oxidase-like deaminating enzyme